MFTHIFIHFSLYSFLSFDLLSFYFSLTAINSLTFCLPKKLFISPSQLKNIFVVVVFYSIVKVLSRCPLACIISEKKLIDSYLCSLAMSFSSGYFEIFSFLLVFNKLIMMYHSVVFLLSCLGYIEPLGSVYL